MSITIDGGAGITFPDSVQQTNGMTMTGGDPRYYAARAWVNFNGTGTVAIRAAVNVSSITDNGVGSYSVNFTTAMPDASYAAVVAGIQGDGGGTNTVTQLFSSGTYSTAQFPIFCQVSDGTNIDLATICAVVFR
jgi:hypothetical protein